MLIKTGFLLLSVALGYSAMAAAMIPGPIPHERKDTPKMENATTGRYFYVGAVPKFGASELDITIAKMGLTVRVQAWVTQKRVDEYAANLYKRWQLIDTALNDPRIILHPAIKLESLLTSPSTANEAWLKIAGQYSQHVLGDAVYSQKRNNKSFIQSGEEDSYRKMVSQAVLRYYFQSTNLTAEAMNNNQLRDQLTSAANSSKLFDFHLKPLLIKTNSKSGYLGYLTFVYPIAVTKHGPFEIPKERIGTLFEYGSMESRWWSDHKDEKTGKLDNKDVFGGFPFLNITQEGLAFHGPISNYKPLDVWYLRRGYVSHGCHRMDSSDVLELRTLLPKSLKDFGKVKLTVLNHFDVTDWNLDGKLEVMDVKYYDIPGEVYVPKKKTVDETIAPYLVENQMKNFFNNNKYATKFYRKKTDTIENAPKYASAKGKLTVDGTHEPLPLFRFEYRPTRIFQYAEPGVKLEVYDDVLGSFPPQYFQQY